MNPNNLKNVAVGDKIVFIRYGERNLGDRFPPSIERESKRVAVVTRLTKTQLVAQEDGVVTPRELRFGIERGNMIGDHGQAQTADEATLARIATNSERIRKWRNAVSTMRQMVALAERGQMEERVGLAVAEAYEQALAARSAA